MAHLYDDNQYVVSFDSATEFESQVVGSDAVWMIQFFSPSASSSQELVPEYSQVALIAHGILHVGAVDLSTEAGKEIAMKHGVRTSSSSSSSPTIFFFGDESGSSSSSSSSSSSNCDIRGSDVGSSTSEVAAAAAAVARASSSNVSFAFDASSKGRQHDNNSSRDPNSDQARILELLHMQTSLMLETQRKLDFMAAKVEALERKIGNGRSVEMTGDDVGGEAHLAPARSFTVTTRTRTYRERDGLPLQDQQPAQEVAPMIAAVGGGGAAVGPHPAPVSPLQWAVNALMKFTMVRILRLFWVRSQGFVQPIDGALIVKLFFMIVVMSARVGRNPSSSASAHRSRISIAVVFLGFLYHTRYLQFLYHFVWKENIPMRVWAGEDVENETTPPPTNANNNNAAGRAIPQPGNRGPLPVRGDLAPNNNNNNNNAAPVGNQDADDEDEADPNFFAGAIRGWIAPRNQDQNAAVGLLRDVFYLFGSFFFSVFPMWQPAGPPPPPPTDDADDGDEEPQQRPEDNNQQQGGLLPDIPRVAAPRDAMAPVEDDDESEQSEE